MPPDIKDAITANAQTEEPKQPKATVHETAIGILGFDPNQADDPTAEMLREIQAEIMAERKAKVKEAATKLMRQIVELSEQRGALDKEYQKKSKELDKALGGLIARVRAAQ